MIINWFGQSCFRIQGDKSVLVTDPFDNSCGLKLPRLTADIVTVSHNHNDHNYTQAVKGLGEADPFIITQPGEYEIKNVFIYGVATYHDNKNGAERGPNIIYRIEIDGITIVHLGDLGHTLNDSDLEKLESADILMVPVGGNFTLPLNQVAELISQIEPRIVIPMHYQIPGLKVKLDNLDKFCKEIGVCPTEKLDKLKITKKDLPQEEMKIFVLEP